MNLRQLEAYLWVARLGSFSKTAERLFTTQPAISSRITNLEDELQVRLFDRDGPKVRLTSAGRSLMTHAEQALGAVEAMRENAGGSLDVSGLLRLGASETIVQAWLPELLARLRTRYPSLDVELSVDVTANLRNELVDHALDLAFLMGPISEYTVSNVPLLQYPLVWATRPTKKLGKKPRMTLDEMKAYPILTYARNTRPYAEIDDAFRQRTGTPPRIFPSTSLSACQSMAQRGVGIGALPRDLIGDALANGELIEISADWTPQPLNFTASYIADPSRPIAAKVAEMAVEVARHA